MLEFDIKGLFDEIDHDLLLRAVDKHTDCRWVRLYLERWLVAPFQQADGTLVERTRVNAEVILPSSAEVIFPTPERRMGRLSAVS